MIRIKLGRKLVKVLGLYSSEVEHWSANPKVRGSSPRIVQKSLTSLQKMTDVITVNRGSRMATPLRWSTKNIISRFLWHVQMALRRRRAGRLGSQVLRVLLDLFWVICVALVRHYFYLIRYFLLFPLNVFLLLDVHEQYHKRQVLLRVRTIFLFRDGVKCVIYVRVLNKNWLSHTTNFPKITWRCDELSSARRK